VLSRCYRAIFGPPRRAILALLWRLMALFRVGDHVALADRPNERLTITDIVDDDPAGATYLVAKDAGETATFAEGVLIRYGSSVG